MTFTTYDAAQAALDDLYADISNIAPIDALDMCRSITIEMERLKKAKRNRRKPPRYTGRPKLTLVKG